MTERCAGFYVNSLKYDHIGLEGMHENTSSPAFSVHITPNDVENVFYLLIMDNKINKKQSKLQFESDIVQFLQFTKFKRNVEC